MLTPLIRRVTGNDIAWDMPVTASTTAEGVYQHQLNRRVRNMQQDLSRDMQQEATTNLVRDWERTKNSFEDWQARNPMGTRGEYNSYIEMKTRNAMDSGIYKTAAGWINNTFDFNGGAGVGEALGQAAANFARQGMRRNDPNALLYGRAMVENLMMTPEMRTVHVGGGEFVVPMRDANGNMIMSFNRDQWGGMNQKAVADLTAALSKETDLLRGIDPSKPHELQAAAGKFKDMVRDYAIALSPLRDVFGDDTASMISSLERMTGQGLSQMGAMRASAASIQLADRYNSGMYGTQFLTNNVRTMQGLVEQAPGLSSIHYLNSLNMGVRGADMARGTGTAPAFMTKEKWDREANKLAFQTSISKAADNIAMDYSIWAKRLEDAAKDRALEGGDADPHNSWGEFQEAMRRIGGDPRRAAGQLSGALSRREKMEGRSYNYYSLAVSTGVAADMAASNALAEQRMRAMQAMRVDAGMERVVQRVDGLEGDELVRRKNAYIKSTLDLLSSRPDLYGVTDQNQLRELIAAIPGEKEGETAYSEAQAEVISSMMMQMFNSDEGSEYQKFLVNAHAVSGRNDAIKYEDAAERRRTEYDKLNKEMLRPGSQLVGDLIKGGFSISEIKERLGVGGYIQQIDGEYNDKDKLSAVLYAAQQLSSSKYGGDIAKAQKRLERAQKELDALPIGTEAEAMMNTEARAAAQAEYDDALSALQKATEAQKPAMSDYMSKFYAYANSVEGLKSKTFRANLDKYQTAVETGDEEGQKAALARLDAELSIGAEGMEKLENATLYTKSGKRMKLKGDKFDLLKDKTSDELALIHADSAIYGLATEKSQKTTAKQIEKARKEMEEKKTQLDDLRKFKEQGKTPLFGVPMEQAQAEYDKAKGEYDKLKHQYDASEGQSTEVNKLTQEIWKEFRDDTDDRDIKGAWEIKRDELTMDARKKLDKSRAKLDKARRSGKRAYIDNMQAEYDAAEIEYHDRMAAVNKIDQQLGMAKRDMSSAPRATDNAELLSVLNKLNNTLDRIASDGSYTVNNGIGNRGNVAAQGNG